jgi:hypothetical protein
LLKTRRIRIDYLDRSQPEIIRLAREGVKPTERVEPLPYPDEGLKGDAT